jgi:6-phosphogluconolactonase (cycloisomerase 2 family)
MAITLNGTTGVTTPAVSGDGSGLTALPSAQLTGALPAISGAALTGIDTESFKPVAVTGATPSLNVGSYNYFDNGTLTANTTVSFASVPTNASWTYTAKGSLLTSAAYNLTVAAYESKLSIAPQEGNLRGLEFSTDGTFLYVIGSSGQDVNQYTLSTAWDVTTATHTRLFSIVGEETDPTDVTFKEDGTEMYVIGEDGDDVNQYTLSTAWDISSATFTRLFSVATQETAPTGIDFKPDGTEMYVCGKTGDDVNQYTLSTAWDISTATFTRLFSVATQDTIPNGVKFSSDGLGMFMMGQATDAVYHYTLSTAWDISSATFTSSFSVSADDGTPQGLAFSADGTRMYMAGDANNTVFQYRTAPYATLTLPSSVVDPPSTAIKETTATYNFTTLDGGTTVSIHDDSPAAAQSTDAGAIGTYTFGRPANLTNYSMGDTATGIIPTSNSTGSAPYYNGSWVNYHAGSELSGTWRCMSEAYSTGSLSWSGLWVRIS